MPLVWKGDDEITEALSQGQQWGATQAEINSAPFSEIKKRSPSNFVKVSQQWCDRNNSHTFAETKVNKKNLLKIESKGGFKLVKGYIDGKTQFSTKEVRKAIVPEDTTYGDFIRDATSYLACLGQIKKEKTPFKDKEQETKAIKYDYTVCNNPERCPYLTEEKDGKAFCNYKFNRGEETNYFE